MKGLSEQEEVLAALANWAGCPLKWLSVGVGTYRHLFHSAPWWLVGDDAEIMKENKLPRAVKRIQQAYGSAWPEHPQVNDAWCVCNWEAASHYDPAHWPYEMTQKRKRLMEERGVSQRGIEQVAHSYGYHTTQPEKLWTPYELDLWQLYTGDQVRPLPNGTVHGLVRWRHYIPREGWVLRNPSRRGETSRGRKVKNPKVTPLLPRLQRAFGEEINPLAITPDEWQEALERNEVILPRYDSYLSSVRRWKAQGKYPEWELGESTPFHDRLKDAFGKKRYRVDKDTYLARREELRKLYGQYSLPTWDDYVRRFRRMHRDDVGTHEKV